MGILKFGISMISTLLYGFTLSIMWNWFVASAFHIAELNITTAIGLSLTVTLFTAKYTQDAEEIDNYWLKTTMFSIVLCVFTLISGFIVHLFV